MGYLSFFKLRFAMGLQYRFSALAGLATQFFWGMMMLFLYEAFYKNGISTSLGWQELVSYIWLGQAFYTVVFFRNPDKDIFECIKNGQVAYEFVRPLNLYWMWFVKICAQRLSACVLRFLPVIIFACSLPTTYSLKGPDSIFALFLFFCTVMLGLVISTALTMLIYILMFFTTSCKGLFTIYGNIADFFSGMTLPIAFMPSAVQAICFILPFRLCMDLPMRLYVGNIPVSEGLQTFLVQIAWAMALTMLGNYMMQKVGKRLVIQGG